MSLNAAFLELQGVVQTTWPWVSTGGGQLRDVQIRRVKWLEFLQALETDPPGDMGLELPFVVEELGPWSNRNDAGGWGYAGSDLVTGNTDVQSAPCSVFLIDKAERHFHTITGMPGGNAVAISSTERFFAGQNLWCPVPGAYRVIVSVDSATQMTLDSVAGLTAGLAIGGYDKSEQFEHEASLLKAALAPTKSFTNFFTEEYATVDLSASNPANVALAKANYPMQAAHVFFTVFSGLGTVP